MDAAIISDVVVDTCTKCGMTKPLAEFNSAGRHHRCKDCYNEYTRGWAARNRDKLREKNRLYKLNNAEKYRDSQLRTMFGITAYDYDEMLRKQDGRCKCCGVEASTLTRRLAVDHCHATDEVRGLLCSNCNTALGLVGDNIDTLNALIAYLEEAARRQGENK